MDDVKYERRAPVGMRLTMLKKRVAPPGGGAGPQIPPEPKEGGIA
jgi:hypothetical protein